MKFKQLSNGMCDGFCLIKSLDVKSTKTGKPYLDMILTDDTGEISAKLWDYDEVKHKDLAANMPVKVRGSLEVYRDRDQFRIAQIRPVNDADDCDISELVASSPVDSNWMLGEIYSIIDKFEDEELSEIVKYLLAKRGDKILSAPAAVNMHHAERGGLLFHTLSIIRMAQKVCEIYPFVDEELLISGAIIHDLGKIDEMETNELGLATGYTEQGELVGHLVKGAIEVEKAAEALGTSQETMLLLEHMCLSHHGIPEYGAAKMPSFVEAEILATLDKLDATLFEFCTAINDVNSGGFSSRQWALDNRKIYNHGRAIGISPRADLKK